MKRKGKIFLRAIIHLQYIKLLKQNRTKCQHCLECALHLNLSTSQYLKYADPEVSVHLCFALNLQTSLAIQAS